MTDTGSARRGPGGTLPSAGFVALGALAALSPWSSPPLALCAGAAFALAWPHPFPALARRLSRLLLQASVVALGFAMDLGQVLAAGRSGFLFTLLGIALALAIGTLLTRALSVPWRAGYLVSVGTAICGGSAIAAVGPAVGASDDEMSLSMGTVFLLNGIGLLVFPPLGAALGLAEADFGLWAALAIHDTSSVVGAAARYGAVALTVATTVKLARALWIVPLTLLTSVARARGAPRAAARVAWPWFILLFLLAAVARSRLPLPIAVFDGLARAGKVGLAVTLFLIGSGMSRESLRKVGARPLVLGVLLWIVMATASLVMVRLRVAGAG